MWKFSVLFFFMPIVLLAQDSLTIKRKGTLSGQWRTYYMGTLNKADLRDYNALATGGKLKYQYQPLKNLEFGAALYNATNVGLQDLSIPDAATGKLSRYEEGLFNRQHLSNDAVFLLGELYVNFRIKRHQFSLGRMKINSPLINPQDGRMIPSLVQGFWYKHMTTKQNIFQLGVLNQIAPRSTGEFYGIGESIGTYPVGRNKYGQASQYAGNTTSNFIILFNADVQLTSNFQLGIWNYYTDNISNSLYLKPKLKLNQNLSLAGEWLHQNKVGFGGNAIDSLRYFNQNTSDILGLKLEYKVRNSQASLSYNRILPNGQFISPREWGRENLFSFQKRERSEGTADSHILVFNYSTSLTLVKDQADLKTIFSIGRHWKPDVTDAVLNKYGMPDYTHINVDLFFNLKRVKQLKPELLFTTKLAQGDFPDNPNFYYNKTNMLHLSLVLNYNF